MVLGEIFESLTENGLMAEWGKRVTETKDGFKEQWWIARELIIETGKVSTEDMF